MEYLKIEVMGAIELGRPLLFASNDGITAMIDPQGKVEAKAPQYEVYVLNGTIQPMQGITPWMQNGLDPVMIIMIILIVIAVRANSLIRNNQTSSSLLQANETS